MPRPEPTFVTFEIDGLEVRAAQGAMLVDGAKNGDVEIPVFCYEPKLGAPVGACRMCLVEIEGMPKLQTACSTPVQEGMVVITTSDRVKQAQNAIVEFLLVNHPLDCPVCDKGGECPLQDISYGWGAGRSRFIEPKRHFRKPLALSPMVAIDRERCILCFRCVRFSQEVAEDYQLVFVERGDHTYVGTHDGRPYVAPFSGNIVDLCPVGALTSSAYRFRARPWDDVEEGGSVCTLCPSQCNVSFTVRDDEKVLRVRPRDNPEVDDGWLCDKGRFGYQAIHSGERVLEPMARDGGALRPVSWERAIADAAAGLKKAGPKAAALVGGQATNEEGYLVQHLMRDVLGSPHVDSRPAGGPTAAQSRMLARPDLTATVSDIEHAGAVLVLDTDLIEESPILDLRVRKAARRYGVKVVVASSRPGALDPNADALVRFAPGAAEATLGALVQGMGMASGDDPYAGEASRTLTSVEMVGPDRPYQGGAPLDQAAIGGAAVAPGAEGRDEERRRRDTKIGDLCARAGAAPEAVRMAAEVLAGVGPVVVLWGERVGRGARGVHGVSALLALARALGAAGTEGAGLIEVPAGANARGLREVGCTPYTGPGLRDAPQVGTPASAMPGALGGGELGALLLYQADPLLHAPRARALGPGDRRRRLRGRLRRLPGRRRGGGRRGLPRRVLRGEGGHGHPPRRPRAARAPGRRPPRLGARRLERAGGPRGGDPRRGPRVPLHPDGVRRGGRRGPLLRGARPGRDRRARRPLAGARGGRGARSAGAARGRAGDPARAARRPAPRDRPHAVGRRGHRALAGAAVPGPRAERRALGGGRSPARASPRATRSRSRPTASASAPGRACATGSRRAACSCSRARARRTARRWPTACRARSRS